MNPSAYIPLTEQDSHLPSAPPFSAADDASLPPPYMFEQQHQVFAAPPPPPSSLPFAIPLHSPFAPTSNAAVLQLPFSQPILVAPSPLFVSAPSPPPSALPPPSFDLSSSRRSFRRPEWSSPTWCGWLIVALISCIAISLLLSHMGRAIHFSSSFEAICTSPQQWSNNLCLLAIGMNAPTGIIVIGGVGFGLVFFGQVGVGLLLSVAMASATLGHSAGMICFGGYVHFAMIAIGVYRVRFAMLGWQLLYGFFHAASDPTLFVSCLRCHNTRHNSEADEENHPRSVGDNSAAARYFSNYHPRAWFRFYAHSEAEEEEPRSQHKIVVWQQPQQQMFVQPPHYNQQPSPQGF